MTDDNFDDKKNKGNPFENVDDLFSVFESTKKRKGIDGIETADNSDIKKQRVEPKLHKDAFKEDKSIQKEQKKSTDKEVSPIIPNSNNNNNNNSGDTNNSAGLGQQDQPSSSQQQQEQVKVSASFLVSNQSCVHEVAIPPNYKGDIDPHNLPPIPENMARQYPFVLDAFQREAIKSIEAKQSVLVSAHTSAGKTAVAEYAIAMSLRDGSRVIYTSPIKALSNQKFREFTDQFTDVGLMTGDVTLNPNAGCVVMTTEILRSMLYRGSELLNEVGWVIFDEVHYMRDKERGVVWEETMVLLPSSVKYVFLSATIPNAYEFAGWICKLKAQPVHVVYTDYRPTPLQQYIFPTGSDAIHLIIDEKGEFREENFQKAVSSMKGKHHLNQGPDIYKIVKMIMDRKYQPAIIFSFSKRECENFALNLSKLDFNDKEDKNLVEEVFNNAIDSLGEDDKKLPQVEHMLPLLKRGIGIHHSGLLPVIKEVVEILFQEGLCKALFSTETFSLGLNMPARTVVFTSMTKFDGTERRMVSSGEYIQMSGRAGRRGIDDKGIVIMMIDQTLNIANVRKLFSGKADPLMSSFHLSYYMILNLLRVEEISPEYILERSFHQYQSEHSTVDYTEKIEELEKQRNALVIDNEQDVVEYHAIRMEIEALRDEIKLETIKPVYALQFLQPGRLVSVKDGADDWGWGIVVTFQKRKAADNNISLTKSSDYIVDVLLPCQPVVKGTKAKPRPALAADPASAGNREMMVIPVSLEIINAISTIRTILPKNIKSEDSRRTMLFRLDEIQKRFSGGIPLLDPIEEMKITSKSLKKCIKNIEMLEKKMVANSCHQTKNQKGLDDYLKKLQLQKEIETLKSQQKFAGQLVLRDDLKKMLRVLRRLGCTNAENVIQLKGRVACEISAADELVVTEMIFNGQFNDLSCEQIVSLLSCFAYDESDKDIGNFKIHEDMEKPFALMKESARKVAKISEESKIAIDEEDYVNSLSPKMIDVTYAWMKGAKFHDICKLTSVFEGNIVRCLRRLEEVLRQCYMAAKAIGDTNLEKKFMDGMTKLKRDIVFSSSLYL